MMNGDNQNAVDLISRAVESMPNFAAAHANLGNAFLQLGRYADALSTYERALALQSHLPDTLSHRGLALRHLGRQEEALESFAQALKLQPNLFSARVGRGNVFREMGRWLDALAEYDEALKYKRDDVDAVNNRGIVLAALERYEEAVESYSRVIAMSPHHVAALSNRGEAFRRMNRLGNALDNCDQALRIDPNHINTLNVRGNVLQDLGRHSEALASFDKARQLDPAHPDAQLNGALCRLLMGNFEEGWPQYEWRWIHDDLSNTRRKYNQPTWDGNASLSGKTILLHSEQGIGDAIQFCRYAKLLAARGANVLLVVPQSIKSLMARVEGIQKVFSHGETLPEFDCHCPLLSLPLALKTTLQTIPTERVYIRPDPELVQTWSSRLGEKRVRRIGIAWAGNKKHRNDRRRSIPLETLLPLISDSTQFVSLQKDLPSSDRATLERRPVLQFGDALTDFSETAALIGNLDMVISVDTSVAHLAGAMGCPTWVLLPFNPDWRWLLDRTDSPWYPTMTLIRQPAAGDWQSVINTCRARLAVPEVS